MSRLQFGEHAATFIAGIVLASLTPDRGLIVAGIASALTLTVGRRIAVEVFDRDEWDDLARRDAERHHPSGGTR